MDLAGAVISQLIDPAEEDELMARLGPDPLVPRTRVNRLRTALARRKIPVGAALLDQSVIAGLGNIYRAEILFACGIDPHRESRSLTDDEVDCIWTTSKKMLREGEKTGKIITVTRAEARRPAVEADRHRPPPGLQARALPALRHPGPERDDGRADAMFWCPNCQPG